MIGFAVLTVAVIYIALLIWVTRATFRLAKRRGSSRKACIAAATASFFAIYLPIFWDHVPTLVTYGYACAKEAGFWEYKTVEVWKKENPEVADSLVSPYVSPFTRLGDSKNYIDTYELNQRFNWIRKKSGPLAFNLWRWEDSVIDVVNGGALATSIDFSTGDGSIGWANWPIKFWLKLGYCKGGVAYGGKLGQIVGAVTELGKRK